MDPLSVTLAGAAIVFGFLFAAFWWSLDREVKFDENNRHFKLSYALLVASIAVVGYFGLAAPLRDAAQESSSLVRPYRFVLVGLVAVLGYMLIEYAHYRVFKWPRIEKLEWVFLLTTLVLGALLGLGLIGNP